MSLWIKQIFSCCQSYNKFRPTSFSVSLTFRCHPLQLYLFYHVFKVIIKMIDWYTDLFLGKCRQMFYWIPSHGWKVFLGLLGSVCPPVRLYIHSSVHLSSVLLFALLSFQKCKFSWNLHLFFFVIFGMGLGGPVELFMEFLQKNPVLAKMTKKWWKMAQKCDFSAVFKNFVVNFCLKH